MRPPLSPHSRARTLAQPPSGGQRASHRSGNRAQPDAAPVRAATILRGGLWRDPLNRPVPPRWAKEQRRRLPQLARRPLDVRLDPLLPQKHVFFFCKKKDFRRRTPLQKKETLRLGKMKTFY